MSNHYRPQPEQQAGLEIINIAEYLQALWANKFKIILLASLVTFLVALWVVRITPQYSATATLLIEQDEAKAISIEGLYGLEGESKEYLTTQYEILRSNALAEQVIDELRLRDNPEFNPALRKQKPSIATRVKTFLRSLNGEEVNQSVSEETEQYLIDQAVLSAFKSRLTVEPVRTTLLVKVSFESISPKLAAEVANAMGQAYIDSHMAAKMAMTNNALNWLQKRSDNVGKELDQAEADLQAFLTREQLVDMDNGVQGVNSSTIRNLNDRLLATRNNRIELENTLNQLGKIFVDDKQKLQNIRLLNASSVIQDLRRAELAAETRLTELDQRYGPKHPKMLAANAELKQVQAKLRDQVHEEIGELQNQLVTLRENERKIEQQLNNAETNFLDAGEKEANYKRLTANVERLTELNNLIVTRFKEMDLTADFNSANARFADKAMAPTAPFKPKKTLIVALALVVSMIASCLVVLVVSGMNNTVKTPEQLESALLLRVLGVLPKFALKRATKNPAYLFFDKAFRHFCESVKTLRTGLLLSYVNNDSAVTLVTSSAPGEGKSTCAMNLSFSLGQIGSVLLIEADLRRSCIATRLGLPGYQPGLTNILTGSNVLSECIYHDERSGIDILTAGHPTAQALELLSSDKMAKLVSHLSAKYSHIVIDSPPCMAVSDALVLSQMCTSTVLIVKANTTNIETAKKAMTRLLDAGAKISGVVMNAVVINEKSKRFYGYYDYYDYSAEQSS